jgi:hypothetical protein
LGVEHEGSTLTRERVTMETRHIYQELSKPISTGNPKFPEVCPKCGADIADSDVKGYSGPKYECGGQFRLKPQIQTHTNYWWGHCPKVYKDNLENTSLLDTESVVWAVWEDGVRKHAGSFSMGFLAVDFAMNLSKSYPRFWNERCKVAYIEAVGTTMRNETVRYLNGERIYIDS